ncbi:MAG: xanthine/uracil permease [Alteromonas macleodii]|jgi:xanthine/uracil permease
MMFAGVAKLIQTIGIGPDRATLSIPQGTSFAFWPAPIPARIGAGTAGIAGLMTGIVIGD